MSNPLRSFLERLGYFSLLLPGSHFFRLFLPELVQSCLTLSDDDPDIDQYTALYDVWVPELRISISPSQYQSVFEVVQKLTVFFTSPAVPPPELIQAPQQSGWFGFLTGGSDMKGPLQEIRHYGLRFLFDKISLALRDDKLERAVLVSSILHNLSFSMSTHSVAPSDVKIRLASFICTDGAGGELLSLGPETTDWADVPLDTLFPELGNVATTRTNGLSVDLSTADGGWRVVKVVLLQDFRLVLVPALFSELASFLPIAGNTAKNEPEKVLSSLSEVWRRRPPRFFHLQTQSIAILLGDNEHGGFILSTPSLLITNEAGFPTEEQRAAGDLPAAVAWTFSLGRLELGVYQADPFDHPSDVRWLLDSPAPLSLNLSTDLIPQGSSYTKTVSFSVASIALNFSLEHIQVPSAANHFSYSPSCLITALPRPHLALHCA